MDIEDFVAEALRQVIAGVKKVQQEADGLNVNAETTEAAPYGGSLTHAGKDGVFTRVDFDLAVSAETGGKAGANLKVFGIGVDAGGDTKRGFANRIQFSVPIRLPDGDSRRAAKLNAKGEAEAREFRETQRRHRPISGIA